MKDAIFKILSIGVPAIILLAGIVIAVLLYVGTRNSVEEAKNRSIYFAAGLISVGLMFLVGGKLFGTISGLLGGYLQSALPGVQGVDTITTAVISIIGFLTFATIVVASLQLIMGTQDSIEGGKKRITHLLIGGIVMLSAIGILPSLANQILQFMKDQSSNFLKF